MSRTNGPERARERATNYFALFETLRNQLATTDAWERTKQLLDVDAPFGRGTATAIGRLDVDDHELIANRAKVARGFQQLRDSDIILELGDELYPARLAATPDAPTFLFVRQESDVLDLPSISIVGTRNASDEGLARARKLAHLLVKRGIAVCSGLALGIDQAAHRGALEIGGVTIAVLGTPITRYYPREHQQLQDQIGFVGAVVSQFHPASKTLPLCFPLRNATMSGLSLGTVVVEASETSGALIQARKALSQQREVFIPKSAIDNHRLRWPRRLRDDGAHVFATIDELLDVLEARKLIPPQSAVDSPSQTLVMNVS